MNTLGFVISFIFLVACISLIWGALSYDGREYKKKEAVRSGIYAFSTITGISVILALIVLILS